MFTPAGGACLPNISTSKAPPTAVAAGGIPIFRRRIEGCLECHDQRFLTVNKDVFCPEKYGLEFAFND